MSKTRFASLARDVREAGATAAWIQWQALGGQAAAHAPSAIVDPEALVLFSLWLADDEPRVRDFLRGFAGLGTRLLSVQRLKTAMSAFPAGTEQRVGGFAALVLAAGKDPRWSRLATTSPPSPPSPARPGKVASPTVRLHEPSSLLLRLRTAFGVDVRTDTLAYLIGRSGSRAGVREIAEDLCYAKYSVRLACAALADAGLIVPRTERPVTYYADPGRWSAVLDLRTESVWHPWVSVYALVLRLEEFLAGPRLAAASESLAASLAREFVMEHAQVLTHLQLDVPDQRAHLREAYLPAFERTVGALAEWLEASV
jgi:hypothetical protein